MMLVAMLTAMWLTVMRTPDTPIARAVWRLTVTAPIAWSGRVRRGDLLVWLAIGLVAGTLLYCVGREGVQLLAMAAPDLGGWLVTFEVGSYVEALAAVLVAASTVRAKAFTARWRVWPIMRRGAASRRAPHAPRPRRSDDAANDDGDSDSRRAA